MLHEEPVQTATENPDQTPKNPVAWTDHKVFTLNGIGKLFNNEKFSDLEIKCHQKSFKVHKLILSLFTDYFFDCDGLWMRIDINANIMESILRFIYFGQVVVEYHQIENFLNTCKFFRIKLFNSVSESQFPSEPDTLFEERYELNDFQLLCRNCYKCFPDEKTMKKHWWACSKPRDKKCRYCEKTFRFKNDVECHERIHTKERPFVCPRVECGRTFMLKSAMVAHVKVSHDKVMEKCQQCGKSFRSKTVLKLHINKAHTDEMPYGCTECGKTYAIAQELKTHMANAHKKTKKAKRR